MCLLGAAPGARAQAGASETAVKAAYVFKFLPYVEWPDDAWAADQRDIVIGVVGAETVASALRDIVAGRMVGGRSIVVRVLREDVPVDINVVFVGAGVPLAPYVARIGARPVLVISDGVLQPGAMLGLVISGGRVRFHAAPTIAERARLKLGARLLTVAEQVVQ